MAHSTAVALDSRAAPRRRFDGWGVLCVGVYVLLGLALIARVPLSLAPDESAHWEYIQHIATTRSLPVFSGAAPPNPGYEFHQPPLYYLLAAPAWALLSAGAQQYSARLVSLMCGALTVWLVLASARAMLGEGTVARRAGILAALWPMHIAIGSSSNNDALAGLCCAALFWRLALLSKRAPEVRDGVWIGALCGLGLLSKSTTLTVSVAAVLGLWHLSRRAFSSVQSEQVQVLAGAAKTKSVPQVLVEAPRLAEPGRVLGAAFGAALVVCGWMLVRNTMLYGDALAFGVFKAASDAATMGPAEFERFVGPHITLSVYVRNAVVILLGTQWGLFGGPSGIITTTRMFAPAPFWLSGWPLLAALFLLAASTWALGRGSMLAVRVGARLRSRAGSSRDVVWLWWSVAVALAGLAYVQFALSNFSGAQGRYLAPALLPFCVLAARAWDDLPRAVRAPLSWAVALILLALTLANALLWRTLV